MLGPEIDDGATDIAIIGMSGRFPGARNLGEFWRNLCDGVESITTFSDEELIAQGVNPAIVKDGHYVKARGVIADVEMFDAAFFGFSPRDAQITDPQHRLFLECAWEAFEDAGYDPGAGDAPVGVFAGLNPSTYLFQLYSNPDYYKTIDHFQLTIGNDKDHLPTLVSYKLNLRGPSMAIQTACSTSLVAVGCACQSLLLYKCDMALAGGVTVNVPQRLGYPYREGSVMSPDGHCRAFDANARGTVGGNGVGVVILKRLREAIEDGDNIHAVIKGAAINNDGSAKVGYTAPSVTGQAEVIAEALALAGVSPDTVGYVEAHGTGTALGDPIEVAALNQVFGGRRERATCALGSVKTNLGHLDSAAGVAGLIKAALTVKHGLIPPSLHFKSPNPEINFAGGPFYVNAELARWQPGQWPRRAGVSSFGIGGTNAHVVLEEPPPPATSEPARRKQLLVLSARTPAALDRMSAELAAHLDAHPCVSLADVAYTLQEGRRPFAHRRAVVAADAAEAIANLKARPKGQSFAGRESGRPVFLFPGQGSQFVGMGADLYERESVYRDCIDRCAELLRAEFGIDLRQVLYPAYAQRAEAERLMARTEVAQPALFAVEYATAVQWMEWGVQPAAVIGHSLGEYVAACVAQVMSWQDALRLVTRRAALMQRQGQGGMLAVGLPESEARLLLNQELSLAAINAPQACVVSGPAGAIDRLQEQLRGRRVAAYRLNTPFAFHSSLMEPVVEAFVQEAAKVTLKPPKIGYVSGVTGTWIKAEQATDPRYWGRQLRDTVRFADGVAELAKLEGLTLLEVGPGNTLCGLARQQLGKSGVPIIASMAGAEGAANADGLAAALGRLWAAGVAVNWRAYNRAQSRRRVSLPTYPFERQRYWVDSAAPRSAPDKGGQQNRKGMAEWFYAPSWKRSHTPVGGGQAGKQEDEPIWLVFADGLGFAETIIDGLRQSGAEVLCAGLKGAARARGPRDFERDFEIDPADPQSYRHLVRSLKQRGRRPKRLIHLWGLMAADESLTRDERIRVAQDRGYYSLLYLAQAIGAENVTERVELIVLTNGLFDVTGEEALMPERATVLGPCRVVPQEYPGVRCRCIDIQDLSPGGWQARQALAEAALRQEREWRHQVVAYRGKSRWVQTFEPVGGEVGGEIGGEIGDHIGSPPERGVFLITGGLGALGLEMAAYLAGKGCRVAVTGRQELPEREQWPHYLNNGGDPRVKAKLEKLLSIEAGGAEVLALRADVADEAQMRQAIAQTRARFGRVTGVIHAAAESRERTYYSVTETGRQESDAQFRPKLQGVMALGRALEAEGVGFCLLMSSLSSVLGGLGFTAYAAANNFLDAYAQKARRESGARWVSVNWDGWDATTAPPAASQASTSAGIRGREGCLALERILAFESASQIAVSTTDLGERIARWVERREEEKAEGKSAEPAAPLHARPAVKSEYAEPETDIELRVLRIWEALLGIEGLGVEDNFFELGGHSLLAIQIISRLREEFAIEVPLRSVFEQPTVRELALVIEGEIIGELEGMTDDEAERLLGRQP